MIPPAGRSAPRGLKAAHAKDVRDALASLNRRGRSKSKYRNERTETDGYQFASKKEAKFYVELRLRERAGDVKNIRIQPRYALYALTLDGADLHNCNAGCVSQRRQLVADYVADFEFEESDRGYGGITWSRVVVDVKGLRTAIYKLKKRLFEAQYGIKIREV